MKKLYFACLFVVSYLGYSQKTSCTVQITYQREYCGGAKPDAAMQQESERKHALPNTTFMLFKKGRLVDSVTTTTNGILKIKLRKGSYQLVEAWRYYISTPNNLSISSFDKNCLIEEWKKIYLDIVVSKRTFTVQQHYDLIQHCDWSLPCRLMQDEIPPAAPSRGEGQ